MVGLYERVRTLTFFQLQPFRRVGCDYRYYVDAIGNPKRHFRADWTANEPGNRANEFISGAELHVTALFATPLVIALACQRDLSARRSERRAWLAMSLQSCYRYV